MQIKKGDKIEVSIRKTFPWWKFQTSYWVVQSATVEEINECQYSSGEGTFTLFTIKTEDGIPHVLTAGNLREMMKDANPSVFRKEIEEAKI